VQANMALQMPKAASFVVVFMPDETASSMPNLSY
jgi:hypothetical protein